MEKSYKSTKSACYIGYIVQAIVNNFLPILFIVFQKKYGLGYEKLGRIILVNFLIQILSDTITPIIVRAIGYRGCAILCHGLCATGLVMLSVLPTVIGDTYVAILLSVIIYAFGSGIIEVIISPMIELIPTKNKAANMAFLHSFYCWGQAFTVVCTTLLVSVFGFLNWNFIPLIWATVPFINMFFFIKVPVIEPKKETEKIKNNKFFISREFICFVVFMLCAGTSEVTMAQWASMFVQQGLGINKVTGDILGPCLFAIAMGIGRVFFGVLSGKFSYRKALVLNNILCFLCYIVVAFCKSPIPCLIACALCGFSVSLSWPGTYSLASARFPNGGTVMFSAFALFGDLGCSLGPWLLGLIADMYDLQTGFFVCSVFPLVMVITALFVLKEKDCKVN